MKKDLKTKLISRKIKKPNRFLMFITMCVLGFLNKLYKVKFKYNYDPKSIKNEPTILLASHASRLEFIYMIYGFKNSNINIVCGYQNIIKKGLYNLFIKLGVISKYLYQPDIVCMKNILKVLKRNGTVGIFPEGIQSTSGSTHPINPATVQFIKRSKANIVVSTSKGAYLATNRYSKDRKKGYIGIDFSLVFTPSMLEEFSEEQIYNILLEKIRYNDFEYNKVARNKYIGKKPNAFGIDKILYKCPDCKKEDGLFVEGDTIICKHCGLKIRVNEYYDLEGIKYNNIPKDIDEWYKWQRRCVTKEIIQDDFELSLTGSICTLKLDKLRKESKSRETLSIGKVILTNRGLYFKGMLNGENVDFDFDAKTVYSLTLSTRGYLEFYSGNNYYMIIPDDPKQYLIKWTLASEEIHNLYDEKWKAACADVYDYYKGDTYE
ncbi:MAG: 1-acyl-sn-glycerol-3-phosphate acyltransferase [Bacilli bacterium]|nr:1-acyl-sn-glycerol-3-phosphate acyltransferase [Bacilli bacterium]